MVFGDIQGMKLASGLFLEAPIPFFHSHSLSSRSFRQHVDQSGARTRRERISPLITARFRTGEAGKPSLCEVRKPDDSVCSEASTVIPGARLCENKEGGWIFTRFHDAKFVGIAEKKSWKPTAVLERERSPSAIVTIFFSWTPDLCVDRREN